jgi:hypothetical protein
MVNNVDSESQERRTPSWERIAARLKDFTTASKAFRDNLHE